MGPPGCITNPQEHFLLLQADKVPSLHLALTFQEKQAEVEETVYELLSTDKVVTLGR